MANSMTDQYLAKISTMRAGRRCTSFRPGKQPIRPAKRVAVVAAWTRGLTWKICSVADGRRAIIRNAGGVVTEDAIRASSSRITCSTPKRSS